jgi:hypothetical protein
MEPGAIIADVFFIPLFLVAAVPGRVRGGRLDI